MRGLYTAEYLSCLSASFAQKRGESALDIGKAFDLIVGTSTGAMIGCALAAGKGPDRLAQLYREHGPGIFPVPVPQVEGGGFRRFRAIINDFRTRSGGLRRGRVALEEALVQCFGNETLGELYLRRGIALAIPAVNMTNHRGRVFKTSHHPDSNAQDDGFRIVDICLATTAAPIFRSLAAIDHPSGNGYDVFVDGGLWANNPVLVALVEALRMTSPGQRMELYCLGTCRRPAGELVQKDSVDWGLMEWAFGSKAAELSIDVQEFVFDHIARLICPHLNRDACNIFRFPQDPVPANLLKYLDLDNTTTEAGDALLRLAQNDASMTHSRCTDPKNPDGVLLRKLFDEMPARPAVKHA
jgi:uncharacterized protein